MVDMGYIENKLRRLQSGYCPKVKITLEYNDRDGDDGAEVDFINHNIKEYTLRIFQSIEKFDIDTVLRHELMHIQDAVDKNFNFDYSYMSSNNFEGLLAKLIWDISIDMRLKEVGFNKILGNHKRIEFFKKKYLFPNSGNLNNNFNSNQELNLIENLIERLIVCKRLSVDEIKVIVDDRIKEYARLSTKIFLS